MRWSTGVTKRIVPGDRCFLMRLGANPKGIIGSGLFVSETFYDQHWSGELERETIYALAEFDMLVSATPDKILPLELLSLKFPAFKWTPQASGQSIPTTIADELENLWQSRLSRQNIPQKPLWEGALWRVVTNRRERNPIARQRCIDFYGLNCTICGFNFKAVYGEAGQDVIHIHHLARLGSVKEERIVDPVRDLRPVCANCHMIIHRRKVPYTIEEVRETLRRRDD